MRCERWGSLSVSDHVDVAALIANVLLYDRLVVPRWMEQSDRNERAYWVERGWDPDLQDRRLDILGDRAVPRPWNEARRQQFRTHRAQIEIEQRDANADLHVTRMLLAQEQVGEKPPGVERVTVIAAFNSRNASAVDYPIADVKDHVAAQGFLISRRLAVPADADDETLGKAVELSQRAKFQRARAALFEWQADALAKGWTPEDALARLADLVDEYNDRVREAHGAPRWRLAFTLFAGALGFAAGGVGLAAAGLGVSLFQFVKLDATPVVEAGPAQPVAMFHEIEKTLGIGLRDPDD